MTGTGTAGPTAGICLALELCAPVQGAGSVAGHLLGGGATSATTGAALAIFHALLTRILASAASVAAHVLSLVLEPGHVSLTDPPFLRQLGLMAEITGAVLVPMLLAATIGAVVRQDTGRLVRTWFVWLPLAATLTIFMIPLVQAAVSATDAMTHVMTNGEGVQVRTATLRLAPTALTVGGGLMAALVGGLILLGALAIWLEMVLRSSAISITVLFLPLVLAGLVWPATAHAVRRVIEILAALILSKFVVAAVLCLGVAALAGTGPDGRPAAPDVLTGVATLLLAAFAPLAVLRLVPLVEAAAIGHLEGRAHQPVRAATHMAGRARATLPLAGRMFDGQGKGAGAGGDGSGDAPGGGGGHGGGGGPAGTPGPGPSMLAGEDVSAYTDPVADQAHAATEDAGGRSTAPSPATTATAATSGGVGPVASGSVGRSVDPLAPPAGGAALEAPPAGADAAPEDLGGDWQLPAWLDGTYVPPDDRSASLASAEPAGEDHA